MFKLLLFLVLLLLLYNVLKTGEREQSGRLWRRWSRASGKQGGVDRSQIVEAEFQEIEEEGDKDP